MKKLKSVYGLVLLAMLIALGIVLSAFLQFRLIGDIKIDLSYIVIVVICYLYGGIVGGISAGLIAGLESLLLSNYGFSISWTSANVIIGLMTGLMISHNPINKPKVLDIHGLIISHNSIRRKVLKHILNISVMTISCAIGLLLVKTIIECNLYDIPFEVKIVKNAVAFGADLTCMIIGYFALLPIVLKIERNNRVLYQYDGNYDMKFIELEKMHAEREKNEEEI